MKRRPWILAAGALCAGVPCARASAQVLTVSAAASMGEAVRDLARVFERERPGLVVRVNVAASGVLLQQIVQGAAVDLLVSADVETTERGIAAGVLDAGTRRDIASNTLVLVVPDAGRMPSSITALADAKVQRVALGKPATVPAGRYAQQALQAAGVWAALQGRLVFADSVRQVLDYVARGEVDAGVVFGSDVAAAGGKVRMALKLGGHAPIRYPALVVRESRQPALAREFIGLLASPRGSGVLARHGFGPP